MKMGGVHQIFVTSAKKSREATASRDFRGGSHEDQMVPSNFSL